MLTQEKLKELLHYNPDTGVFTWLKTSKYQHRRIGTIAGCIDKYDGYRKINIMMKGYREHRLAFFYMIGEMPNYIDHINHNKIDNRWSNLRSATKSENSRNSSLRRMNKTGINGVGWHKRDHVWFAQIWVDMKKIHLGNYKDFFEACCARMSANNYYGYHANHGLADYGLEYHNGR